jgi:methionyl-tRNA formyltransferase
MHPSLLPHCRGKDSNFWSIVERRPFGVTIHHVDSSVDGGAIAFQREIPVTWEDTGHTLYKAAQSTMVTLFIDSYTAIANRNIPAISQVKDTGSFHFRRELGAASVLDLNAKVMTHDLLNLLRARTFPPHPGCTFVDGDGKYEITVKIRKL